MIIISSHDYQQLLSITESNTLKVTVPDVISLLSRELRSASILTSDQLPANIVTMNARMTVKNIATMLEAEITLVYPYDADPARGKVSVCSFTGIALLGRKAGDIVRWKTPLNNGIFSIIKVTYQPEAGGVYLS